MGKMIRWFKCLMIVALATGAPVASAQSSASIGGSVVDQSGAVLADALVKALNVASGGEASVKTDSTGRYQLSGLSAGSYRISVVSAGFATAARTLTLRNHDAATQDFSLAPGALEDSITVTAGRGSARVAAETPQTITVADANDIESHRPSSTLGAVETTPNMRFRFRPNRTGMRYACRARQAPNQVTTSASAGRDRSSGGRAALPIWTKPARRSCGASPSASSTCRS